MYILTPSASLFAKTIFLLIITAHRSLQDNHYDPSAFSGYGNLRSCAQFCVDPNGISTYNPGLVALGCSTNDCICRADILSQAVSAVSTCAVTSCSNGNDVASATSFMQAYCSSVDSATFVPLLTSTISSGQGSSVTGTMSMFFFGSSERYCLKNPDEAYVLTYPYFYGSSCNGDNHARKRTDCRCGQHYLRIRG